MRRLIAPFGQLRALKNLVIGGSLYAPKTRNTLFQTFSPKSDIVMIGDSITEQALWNEIFTNVKIANRGIGGDTTDDILRRMDTIFSVSPYKAFVMVGINDIYKGRSVDEIFNNYVRIVKEIQSKNIRVYVQSTLECQKSKCGINLTSVRLLNKKLNGYATANNIKYININEGLTSDTDGLLSDYTPDGIHLNGKGYLVWSKTISPYVNPK
jgi:lysophospholipase L1-like esterase